MDGSSMSFWKSKWVGHQSLCSKFERGRCGFGNLDEEDNGLHGMSQWCIPVMGVYWKERTKKELCGWMEMKESKLVGGGDNLLFTAFDATRVSCFLCVGHILWSIATCVYIYNLLAVNKNCACKYYEDWPRSVNESYTKETRDTGCVKCCK